MFPAGFMAYFFIPPIRAARPNHHIPFDSISKIMWMSDYDERKTNDMHFKSNPYI
jgi:hypothetical protein